MSKKSNTRTTICTSKCCHREIIERVIYPHLSACLRATLLLMASSFFLCSLYFPSDSGACFIVFCHVSVIAPTACLMLSRFFFVCVCVCVCVWVCVPQSPHQGRLWVCGAEPSCGRAPHRVKWQPLGHHWLMTVKTLAVKWETGCHSATPHLCVALTTAQRAALQLDSAAMQQTTKGPII